MSRKPTKKSNPTPEDEEPLLPIASIPPGSLNSIPLFKPTTIVHKKQERIPKRTTKLSQKLALFPNDDTIPPIFTKSEEPTTEQLPHVLARTKQERLLNTLERKYLPRVTAYCTANSFKLDKILEHLRHKPHIHRASPKRFDEVIYTPYNLNPINEVSVLRAAVPNFITLPTEQEIKAAPKINTETLLEPSKPPYHSGTKNLAIDGDINGKGDISAELRKSISLSAIPQTIPLELTTLHSFEEPKQFDEHEKFISDNVPPGDWAKSIAPVGEILYFDYGVVVMWGYTEAQEKLILEDLVQFQTETLNEDSMETEQFYFHYNSEFQPRIYNDIITLKTPNNYMLKLTISHAIAQSVKLTLFEGLIEETIENTRSIPSKMAEDGKIHMSRTAINKKIGQLFIMRINVNLVSNVLDTPEIFWSEPALEPLYRAIRGYLEISQRYAQGAFEFFSWGAVGMDSYYFDWYENFDLAFEIIIGVITISIDLLSYFHRDT